VLRAGLLHSDSRVRACVLRMLGIVGRVHFALLEKTDRQLLVDIVHAWYVRMA
jgi:hypothetical protein